ncbi:DUF2971 domain-containing protein [Sphingorhabdus sp. YGSMI21]|uniref:DUF2971 domain-containing protein n=1 Tax=Sphingorhabdus sp. YGSMI21 TaxID=2077182 RepID=UPI000C1EB193|nr:DUF2971 domain-containing protein [Sphingorhabdus sp. YGSMI21]ATW02119.1 hypothetical protein CHN51_00135 [Sphingorhabdus sp. YGSMI21]
MIKGKRPRRLYKYRSFSNLTLTMLVEDVVYLADPTTFNDPLDTKPTLNVDIDNDALEGILSQLIEQRSTAEMSAAAKSIKYRGPKTINHIARQSRKKADQLLADIRYNATNPDYEIDDPTQHLLRYYLQEELLRRYNKGVFSLAERANCPLMWSHYGDQHRGLCLGYSIPDASANDVYKIQYGGSRLVEASSVFAMLDGDEAARQKVDESVLLKKAKPWGYEREWRLIGMRGEHSSPLELEEVIFGTRCTPSVKFAVVKALEDRDRAVQFFEIHEQHGSFLLKKRLLNTDELIVSLPRRSRQYDASFDGLTEVEGLKSE